MRIITLIFCGIVVTGCSRAADFLTPPNAQPIADRSLKRDGYDLLYRWTGGNNGGGPFARLTDVHGTLYGTTYAAWSQTYEGTVFKITTSGTETVLYRFTGGKDGAKPFGGLTYLNGTFYGTTQQGGVRNCGTVFTVTPSGTKRTLYSFKCGGKDGSYPRSDLADVSDALYGTTYMGGASNLGTVYTITTSGTERLLHSFKGGADGARPFSTLTDLDGTLYGTTVSGGGSGNFGIVFKIATSGAEKVLYRFKGGADGAQPVAGLTAANGLLYGTTRAGGVDDKGTVFKITTSGAENVLYSFKGGTDGNAPDAPLLDVGGIFYGTTVAGGTTNSGTVFKITRSGTESVLYSFKGKLEGFGPVASLTDVNGALYGDTTWGGEDQEEYSCCGTVFRVSR